MPVGVSVTLSKYSYRPAFTAWGLHINTLNCNCITHSSLLLYILCNQLCYHQPTTGYLHCLVCPARLSTLPSFLLMNLPISYISYPIIQYSMLAVLLLNTSYRISECPPVCFLCDTRDTLHPGHAVDDAMMLTSILK